MNRFFGALLAVAVPPFSVLLREGRGAAFVLNLALTLCFYAPGAAHALWLRRRSG